MVKNQPPPDEADNTPAVPTTTRPEASDTKTVSTVAERDDLEATSCKAGDDVDWEQGVPGRPKGTSAEVGDFFDFGDGKDGKEGSRPLRDGEKGERAEGSENGNKTIANLSDEDLSRSYRDLKEQSYTSEGRNNPQLKKQLEELEGEKVSRLKAALGKGNEAFAKALGDIDFNDRDNANLTCSAFGNLCREGGFGGELKYSTNEDTGATDIRLFMKKDNGFDTVNLKSSKPSADESKELAAAVRKSLEQRGNPPGNEVKPPTNQNRPAVDQSPRSQSESQPRPGDSAAEARAEGSNTGNDTASNPEVSKNLERYRALLQLMDNFKNFDTNPADKALTLDELKNLKSDNPEVQKAARYAAENFDKLSGGADGITRDNLKQPLIEALTDSVKASKGKDGIPPAVKEALASWVMMPGNKDEAKYLEDKINKNLEGSGQKVTISRKDYPDITGKDVPVTTISIKSDQGSDQFSYTPTEVAQKSGLPGTPMKGGLTLLETKDPEKSLGQDGPFAQSLAKFHTLKNLKEMARRSDGNHDSLFSKAELDGVEPYDSKDSKAKDYATKHFQELAKTTPKGDALNINLNDNQSVAEKSPELKQDLDFLAKVFPHDPSVSIEQIKEYAQAAEANQQSPLSKGFSVYDKGKNQGRQADIEKMTEARDGAKSAVDNFDALEKQYGGSKDEGSRSGLRNLVDKNAITDPKLAAAAKEVSQLSSGGNFSREGIEKSIKALTDKPTLYGFEKDQLSNLQYGLDNFDKLRELSLPKEPSIDLSKIPEGADAASKFLRNKDNHYGIDKDHDGRVTRAELNDYVQSHDKDIKTQTDAQAEEKKLYTAAMERFKSILANPEALVKATKGDAPAISSDDIDNSMLEALAETIKMSASENGSKIPKPLEDAIHEGIGTRQGKELQLAKEKLNNALKGSGYQVDLSIEAVEGPHGPSARKVTFKLIDQKNPSQPGTFFYEYDTLR